MVQQTVSVSQEILTQFNKRADELILGYQGLPRPNNEIKIRHYAIIDTLEFAKKQLNKIVEQLKIMEGNNAR